MVEATLVKDWIEAGRIFTESLDAAGFRAVASFWLLDEETGEWRLIIATPMVDAEGPKSAYRRVQDILREHSELSQLKLSDISVVSPNYELVKLLRLALRTGKGITGIRFSKNRINDRFIEDAYIYRLM